MTQEQLDTLTELWCLTAQESLGEFELYVEKLTNPIYSRVEIVNLEVGNIMLPCEVIKDNYTPKEKAKIIISLLEQIVDNGDQWLQDEEDYHGDKLAERWDDKRKSNLEND